MRCFGLCYFSFSYRYYISTQSRIFASLSRTTPKSLSFFILITEFGMKLWLKLLTLFPIVIWLLAWVTNRLRRRVQPHQNKSGIFVWVLESNLN